jgi:hypothetical protein
MDDLIITPEELTPALIAQYQAIVATMHNGVEIVLRPDKRLAPFVEANRPARTFLEPPKLLITVPDYQESTITPLVEKVQAADRARLGLSLG